MSAPFWHHVPARNQRLDPVVYTTAGQAVFFTVRTYTGTRPFHLPRLADIVIECLIDQSAKCDSTLLLYCVMPDHVHFIVAPTVEGASVLTYVERFKGYSSRCLHLTGWPGKIWQPRSYDRVIRRENDLQTICDYILENPVRKGLCSTRDDWKWSALIEKESSRATPPRSPGL